MLLPAVAAELGSVTDLAALPEPAAMLAVASADLKAAAGAVQGAAPVVLSEALPRPPPQQQQDSGEQRKEPEEQPASRPIVVSVENLIPALEQLILLRSA